MKQFHEGISSKTFKKENQTSINPLGLAIIAAVGLVLSINI